MNFSEQNQQANSLFVISRRDEQIVENSIYYSLNRQITIFRNCIEKDVTVDG